MGVEETFESVLTPAWRSPCSFLGETSEMLRKGDWLKVTHLDLGLSQLDQDLDLSEAADPFFIKEVCWSCLKTSG